MMTPNVTVKTNQKATVYIKRLGHIRFGTVSGNVMRNDGLFCLLGSMRATIFDQTRAHIQL